MMGNCFSIGAMLILLLGFFCLYNCYQRVEPRNKDDWHGCRDQDGRRIDSFILYKLPMDHTSQNRLVRQGLAYMYLIPDAPMTFHQSGGVSSLLSYSDSTIGWLLSDRSVGDSRSMPGNTLAPLYQYPQWSKRKALSIFYNDEFPNGTTSVTHGHTKGVVMMTEKGGFWLVHSTPRYPPAPYQGVEEKYGAHHESKLMEFLNKTSKYAYVFRRHQRQHPLLVEDHFDIRQLHGSNPYDYPVTGTRYGQTFFCVSLPPHQADNLGAQLLHNKPYIYSSTIGSEVQGKFPALETVIQRRPPHPDSKFRVTQLQSQRGNKLTSFAKYTDFGKDLYSALVAPELKTSLLVESWRNGPKPLPSLCNESQYSVENVEELSVRVSGSSFTTHHDHSKWAVSNSSAFPYVCIGDINRMATQFHRAGGTLCVLSDTIWNRFYKLVTKVESCNFTQEAVR